MPNRPAFDYSGIPVGFYDAVLHGHDPVRRLWHLSKFERVLDCLPASGGRSILDIGCFAGSFLSLVPRERFSRQLGVDILASQVEYARAKYGTPYREFRTIEDLSAIGRLEETFDCVTLIEVIEHLTPEEAGRLLALVAARLRPGGQFVLTTPNYTSAWPLVEAVLDRWSEVRYVEQHLTRFDYFHIERQLQRLYPAFQSDFAVRVKTTSHFLAPFLARVSFPLAHRLSRLVPHALWRNPFGNLVVLVSEREPRAGAGAGVERRAPVATSGPPLRGAPPAARTGAHR